jgi:hypothetical protein
MSLKTELHKCVLLITSKGCLDRSRVIAEHSARAGFMTTARLNGNRLLKGERATCITSSSTCILVFNQSFCTGVMAGSAGPFSIWRPPLCFFS